MVAGFWRALLVDISCPQDHVGGHLSPDLLAWPVFTVVIYRLDVVWAPLTFSAPGAGTRDRYTPTLTRQNRK